MNDGKRKAYKTKAALCKAFAKLVKEKPMHTITVCELCDTAGVHRATFYYHYDDILEFYKKMEQELFSRLKENYSTGEPRTIEAVFRGITKFTKENADLCSIFYGQPSGANVQQKIFEFVKSRYKVYWSYRLAGAQPDKDWDFLADYYISGCISVLTVWYRSGFELSSEHVTELLLEISAQFDELMPKHFVMPNTKL